MLILLLSFIYFHIRKICAKNVSMCTIIQSCMLLENTVKQLLRDNEMVEMLTENCLFGETRRGQVAVCLRLVSGGFGMSRESSDRSDLYYSMGTVPPYGHTQWLLTLRRNISDWSAYLFFRLAVLVCCVFAFNNELLRFKCRCAFIISFWNSNTYSISLLYWV